MKRKFTNRLACLLAFTVLLSCSDDDEGASAPSLDFAGIATTAEEATAGTITIPLRGVSGSEAENIDLSLGGTAVEGEDYSVVGVTAEGVQIAITDDSQREANETIRIEITSDGLNLNGNNIHTVTIVSNCEDTGGFSIADFAGEYDALEMYGPEPADWYGPYHVEFVQDETDPNKFHFDNFWDSGYDAYVVFDLAAGTVYFPDQSPGGLPLTGSTGTFTFCDGPTPHLSIQLDYYSGVWTYDFVQVPH